MAHVTKTMSRRSASPGNFFLSFLGYEVPAWLAVVVGTIGVYIFLKLIRKRPRDVDGDQATRPNATTMHRQPPVPSKSSRSLIERIQSREYGGWSIAVTTDALWPADIPVPIGDAPAAAIQALQSIAKASPVGLVLIHELLQASPASASSEKKEVLDWARRHLAPCGIKPHQILFTMTPKGTESAVRQLLPSLLVSRNGGLCNFMAQFIPYALIVGGDAAETLRPAVVKVAAIDALSW